MIGWLLAAQLAVVAHAPDSATTCAPVEITAAVRAPGGAAPRLTLPASPGVQLLRVATTSRPDPDAAGSAFTLTEATFTVALHGAGGVKIPGVLATTPSARGASAPLPVALRDASEDPDDPQVLVRARLDDGREVSDQAALYVGQEVDYVVDVQLNSAARHRLRRNPTFFPPDMPAVLAYDVAPVPPVARAGAQCFETLTYRRALFPLFPGRTVIPPAVLSYALPVSTSFFSREESREVRTDSVEIVATEPPAAGRPADYAGAVGALRASARLGSSSARMGDPVILTLRVEGVGNVKLLPRPAIDIPWAAVATGPERVDVDTAHARVSGAKEFDWLLTPRQAGRMVVPPIRYPYFDPAHAAYELALTDSIALDVASASMASADTATTPRLVIRTTLRAELPPPMTDRPAYWLLLALAPVPATLRRVSRVKRRARRGASAAQRLRAASRARSPMVAPELRRLWLDTIRERIPTLQPATTRMPLARQLRRAGVTERTADEAERLLDRLDTAAFSGSGVIGPAVLQEAERVAAAIDAQAVRTVSRAAGASAVVLVALLVAGGAAFALRDGVARTFDEGVHAYQAGDAALAQRQFARVAARLPRAEDAWLDMGDAAWARGDTVHAAAAWQRALRLAPLDAEARDHLAMLPAPIAVDARGYVPPVPVDLAAGLALACWVVAWLALALSPTRRPTLVRPVAGGMIALAIVCLVTALELHDRLGARGLGVLRSVASLRDGPADGAPAGAAASIGEVGLLGAREGSWVRISLDGARAGWVRTSVVLPLDDAASD